ncbi:Acyl-CoA dehydrogenase apdG [Fulvia fulva]|uniref:Acyl-CoA dehydrogenase apdG n=1 Tax=Passalora fulva TaxID=5499 RepID=A0A9Q8P3J5_PASFU|nr:Acyl-CoA dehydrogenase apdG [Fulvia fulva]KAK4636117.1 Acyl-CoA dehydrogenase apdG [Fulvia fulva]KAK4636579.1 Acyl-CoA dehydrogenase apdG [Fulvia fulva]UJO11864.1 Acyl-CoA dehydrogenase apdG [Fulvia fulva]WPV08721.1 Acyl-CoA dehydrogenase apdG [Fulvia fulva]WPV24380.1 Acyl-CoA dehydrogenase apdG [Fulvia fulva]
MATIPAEVPIPFSEPPYALGLPVPWYTPELQQWQRKCREFITEHLTKNAWEWEKEETVPEHVFKEFAQNRMLIPSLPSPLPVRELKDAGIHDVLGVKVEDFTYWHNYIYGNEMLRSGLTGPSGSLTTGIAFGVPPIIKFGNEQLKKRFLPGLLRGEMRTCIAITEPDAGSDVANIQTTAVKSKDGKKYIVNGTKKWITNAYWSDNAAMAVRTGGPGPGGLSMLVVPLKGHKGVEMRRLKVQGQISAGTTFIELDDVEVPVENLIGEEGQGMRYIMTNFNHERLTIAIGTTRQARVALSAAFAYVLKREAFGKTLFEQPVVRHRLAKAGTILESQQAWIEQFVYQMTQMKKEDADRELGGLTAACKAQAGIVLKECADCAVLLFGGNGYTRSGQGEIAERMWREVNGNRIPGGSEDVMLDLMVRQLGKNYQKKLKELEKGSGAKL